MKELAAGQIYIAIVHNPYASSILKGDIVTYLANGKVLDSSGKSWWPCGEKSEFFKNFKCHERETNMSKADRINDKINAIPDVCKEGKDAIRALMEEVTDIKLTGKKERTLSADDFQIVERDSCIQFGLKHNCGYFLTIDKYTHIVTRSEFFSPGDTKIKVEGNRVEGSRIVIE